MALGRLWDTHPKLAFPLHVVTCGMIGFTAIYLWTQGSGWATVVILAVLFLIDVAAVVVCTVDAAQRGWTRDSW